MPATAAWGWDLRPLELGLPAHYRRTRFLYTSGRGGVQPATGLVLGVLEQMVRDGLREKGFVDEAIVSEMISGNEDDIVSVEGASCFVRPAWAA